jgi:hypothetical protein
MRGEECATCDGAGVEEDGLACRSCSEVPFDDVWAQENQRSSRLNWSKPNPQARAPRPKRLTSNNPEQTTFIKDENMKIISVRFQRVANLGNYETERCEAEAQVEHERGETPEQCAAMLREWVYGQLGIEDLREEEYLKKKKAVERFERRRGF